MKIAVDAMGGDFGPEVTVAGAMSASREYQIEVLLVGAEAVIQEEFEGVRLAFMHYVPTDTAVGFAPICPARDLSCSSSSDC